MGYLARLALIVGAVALFADCSESQPPIGAPGATPQSRSVGTHAENDGSWIASGAKGQRLIYVANGGSVLVFPERPHNPRPIAHVTQGVNGAQGLCVDRHGNLYVANGGTQTITVYRQGSSIPFLTYSGGGTPRYPIVDHNGNVFASSSNGTVVEWIRGQTTTPEMTLQTPGYETDGIALDKYGNLYATYRTAYLSGGIEEFRPGSTQGRILGMNIVQPQGLIVTDTGAILVVQTGRADGIYEFPPGSQTPSLELSVGETPVQLAITEPEHKLFVSAFGWLGSGRIYVAPYPLDSQSHFHTKIIFRLRRDGHRRRHRWGIQGMALGNGQYF